MTTVDRFERDLPAALEDLYLGPVPAYRNDILSLTAATRQRPGWTFPERWLPMSAITERMATAPRVPVRAVALVALLILALVAAAIYAGSQQRRLPEPFGPAGNGVVAFEVDGDIFLGDATAGTSRALVTGEDRDTRPVFSPDGTKVAFLRDNADIVIVDADGSHERVVTTQPAIGVWYLSWTPDSASVVAGLTGQLVAFDIDRPGDPRVLVENPAAGGDAWNNQMSGLFRPPSGDQLLLVRSGTLSVVDADGSNRKVLVDQTRTDIGYSDLWGAVWSPDGSKIAFVAVVDENLRVYIMNADGSDLHLLRGTLESMGCLAPCARVGENNPQWSPDGSRIAVNRWFQDSAGNWLSSRPVTIVDLATGASREIDISSMNGYFGWGWSPDGESILLLPDDDLTPGGGNSVVGTMTIADAATGAVRTVDWDAAGAPSWQRVAAD
jgi:Tol biopolymer transport system component